MTPEQPLRGLRQQAGAGAVDELQLVILVEREDRDVDLRHDLAQQRRRFERVEALMPQRFDQGVDLDHDLAERVAAARAARPNGEVPLAERGEQVRERLQGQDDALAQREREAEAERDDEDGERPLDLRRVVAGPEEDERDERARQRRGERHQQDASVVAEARLAGGGSSQVQGSGFKASGFRGLRRVDAQNVECNASELPNRSHGGTRRRNALCTLNALNLEP